MFMNVMNNCYPHFCLCSVFSLTYTDFYASGPVFIKLYTLVLLQLH